MKTRLTVILFVIGVLAVSSFAQVSVTSKQVTYKRTGENLMDHKKEFWINYPEFKGNDQEAIDRLKRTFSYWRVFGTSLKEETDLQWLESMDFKVTYNKYDVMVMELMREGSGAYPSGESVTVVANSRHGHPIKFTRVFKNRIGLLTAIDVAHQKEMKAAEKQFASGGGNGSLFDREVEKASDQVEEFSVDDYGVTFIYDYGFPHVSKGLEPEGRFFFSWKDFNPYLKEYSDLSTLIKNAPETEKIVPIIDMKMGGLLGGVLNGKFVNSVTASKALATNDSFVLFSANNVNLGMTLNKYNAQWKATLAAEQMDDICPDFRTTELMPKAKKGVAIGGNGNWDPVPQKVEEIAKNNRVYKSVVANFLKTKGLTNPVVKIEQLYKVDLEGDGADEIVIRATNFKYSENEMVADKDGYSFVLVRKIVDGTVKDILLAGDFVNKDHPGAENKHEVSSILDLNGDGTMEVVVFGEYYEGAWVSVYGIENGKAKAVLETGCGV